MRMCVYGRRVKFDKIFFAIDTYYLNLQTLLEFFLLRPFNAKAVKRKT